MMKSVWYTWYNRAMNLWYGTTTIREMVSEIRNCHNAGHTYSIDSSCGGYMICESCGSYHKLTTKKES